jgi:DNA-binding transcriptional regulator GbsR (MarR family)
MKGYSHRTDVELGESDTLTTWEELVTNAVGQVIEFWGFKRNHGRTWALMYLRGEPMASATLREELGLSKGAVSMITRDLEQWGVAHRLRVGSSKAWHFVAEVDFLDMIRQVLRDREMTMVERVRTDLKDAMRMARREDADEEVVERIERMYRLADLVKQALDLFLSTARLDVTEVEDVL